MSNLVTKGSSLPPIALPSILKVQVPVGGRGKAGGIRKVDNRDEYEQTAKELFALEIKGYTPSALLAEEPLDIKKEFYLSLLIDRSTQSALLLANKEGGVEVESMDQQSFLTIPLQAAPGKNEVTQIMKAYELDESFTDQLQKLLKGIWDTFTTQDALLVEINPLVLTNGGKLICADAKIELDDAALYRHEDWRFENTVSSAQFVVLDNVGTVACMANGAGLAMATVDAIKAAGASPANFLDIGGGTNTDGMVAAFEQIKAIKSVKAIIINVFAGISRCDEVAQAIVIAKERFSDLPPLFIRLSGTNEAEGKAILKQHNIATLSTLQDCVTQAVKEVPHV